VITDLHSIPDDFQLHALGNTKQSTGLEIVSYYYLTDPSGNYLVDVAAERLTDPSGNYLKDTAGNYLTTVKNRLVGGVREFVYPLVLNALQDDFNLNSL